MKNTENKKPIFELGFSTQLLNEIERERALIEPIIKKKLDIIDNSEDLTSEEKLRNILSIRKEQENLYIKMLMYLGIFNSYIVHCEYLIYACEKIGDLEVGDRGLIKSKANRLSSNLERLKKYDLKDIENLIFKVNNSLNWEETDEYCELSSIDNLALILLSSAEKVDLFDSIYREQYFT